MQALGQYMLSGDIQWRDAKEKASQQNSWFIPEFVERSAMNIANAFLQGKELAEWAASYTLPPVNADPKTVGIVMAGNIPLVGFHDLLCVFVSGHGSLIKPSSRDDVLIRHLVQRLHEWNPSTERLIAFADRLNGCDAYIATGSNNSAGYFDYYFGKFPHIIRHNRTSVAIVDGSETTADLGLLADDVFLYFGLGCRNVTKLYVPYGYDFIPLLTAFRKYDYLADHHKYKNNYDYNLAVHMLNGKFYMSTPGILLLEDDSLFSPISQLNYHFYKEKGEIIAALKESDELQCISGKDLVPFGQAQCPPVNEYADGIDTMAFLSSLR